jgi:glycosyltransferase involved in cell wall biosynthesis
MKITVAICTWNRANLLDKTLTGLHRLHIPNGVEWEVLVVNNNSTDNTDQVIVRHAQVLPIRRIFEPRQGHSNARNRAIESAKGDLLLWTDDDVLVDSNWLTEYIRAANTYPEAAFFGGRIDPWFESSPPPWIERNLQWLRGPYAIAQLGDDIRPLMERELPNGANMAFRTNLLQNIRFNPMLGRVGSDLLSADDHDVCKRFCIQGFWGLWVGSARVQHYIPRERLTMTYIQRWFYGAGRTDVRLKRVAEGTMLCGVPRWVLRCYVEAQFITWCLFPWKTTLWFQAFRNSAILRGIIDEYRANNSDAHRYPNQSDD